MMIILTDCVNVSVSELVADTRNETYEKGEISPIGCFLEKVSK